MNRLTKTVIELGLAGLIAGGCAANKAKDYFLVDEKHEDYQTLCNTLGIEESQKPKFKIKEDEEGKGYDITVLTKTDKEDVDLTGTMIAEDPRIQVKVNEEKALYKGFMKQLDDDGNITPNEAVHAARKYLQFKDAKRKTHPFYATAGNWARKELQELKNNYKNVLDTAIENETEMGIQLQVKIETREGEIPKKTPWTAANILLADLKNKNAGLYEKVVEQYGNKNGVIIRGQEQSTATINELLEMTEFFGTEKNKLETSDGLNIYKCALRAVSPANIQYQMTDTVREALGYEVKKPEEKKPEEKQPEEKAE